MTEKLTLPTNWRDDYDKHKLIKGNRFGRYIRISSNGKQISISQELSKKADLENNKAVVIFSDKLKTRLIIAFARPDEDGVRMISTSNKKGNSKNGVLQCRNIISQLGLKPKGKYNAEYLPEEGAIVVDIISSIT